VDVECFAAYAGKEDSVRFGASLGVLTRQYTKAGGLGCEGTADTLRHG